MQENGVDPHPGEKPDRPPIEIKQPAEQEAAEPPQIKVPVEVAEGKNKEEEVQLNRPGAGNAFSFVILMALWTSEQLRVMTYLLQV